MNVFKNNSARRADFRKLLNAVKWAPSSVVSDFLAYETELNNTTAERQRWSRDAAEALISAVREKAHKSPTPENLSALAALDAESVRRRFASANDEVRQIEEGIVNKFGGGVGALCGTPLCRW